MAASAPLAFPNMLGEEIMCRRLSGSSTATTGTTSQTVDDFAVTVTEVNGDLQTSSNPMAVNAQTATFTVTSTTSYVMSSVSGSGTAVW